MTSLPSMAVVYVITPESPYPEMVEVSAASVRKHSPGVPVHIMKREAKAHECYAQKADGLLLDVDTDWLLLLDADTYVQGPLEALLNGIEVDAYARRSVLWDYLYHRGTWRRVCARQGWPYGPLYSSGAVLVHRDVAKALGRVWRMWTVEALPVAQGHPNLTGWHADEYGLSLALAKMRIGEWGPKDHGYAGRGEMEATIFHPCTRRWPQYAPRFRKELQLMEVAADGYTASSSEAGARPAEAGAGAGDGGPGRHAYRAIRPGRR